MGLVIISLQFDKDTLESLNYVMVKSDAVMELTVTILIQSCNFYPKLIGFAIC